MSQGESTPTKFGGTSGEAMDTASGGRGGKRKGGPLDGGGTSISQADTRGEGGTGGTSGGGGNSFWHGLGAETHEQAPEMYSDTCTYRRSYHVQANMMDVTPKAEIDFNNVGDNAIHTGEKSVKITANHGMHQIPYFFKECSTTKQDWNRDPNCIGYRCKSFGFVMKNMRLEVLNNDRADPKEVAPNPPPDARFFIYIDTDHTYGIPYPYTASTMVHNGAFTDEDARDQTKCYLPKQTDRIWYVEPSDAGSMLDRGWVQTGATKVYTHIDPNYLFNIKKKATYQEALVKDTDMSFEYKTYDRLVTFPHGTIYTPHGSKYEGPETVNDNIPDAVTEWVTHVQDNDYTQNVTSAQDTLVYLNWNHHVGTGGVPYRTGATYTAGENILEARYGEHLPLYLKPGKLNGTKQRDRGFDARFDNMGKSVLKSYGDRPPGFYFGIYPEYEFSSSGIKPFRYYLCGQIEYFSVIEWVYSEGMYPLYWPIGKGGRYTDVTYTGALDVNLVLDPLAISNPYKLIMARDLKHRMGFKYPVGSSYDLAVNNVSSATAKNQYMH